MGTSNDLRVHVHPADVTNCGYSRLRWPAQVLTDQGHDVTIGAHIDAQISHVFGPVEMLVDADVVVFQRILKQELVEIIPLLQRQGTAVVVEIDDDFHALPKGHPMRAAVAPMRNPHRNRRWLMEACYLADLVTVTTPALAERYGHGHARILPNCVPAAYLDAPVAQNARVTIGWPGTPASHVGDLEVVGDAMTRTLADTGAAFRAIGSERTNRILGVDGEVVPWVPLTDFGAGGYASTVASLDIGIAPLAANEFNDAKSDLKPLEFAALGVPFVASPSPEYQRIHDAGAGRLADTPDDWHRELTRLATDELARAELVERGRAAVVDRTYERQAWRWMEAWADARALRTGAHAA